MVIDEKDNNSDEWLNEIPLQTESENYQSDELIGCKKCNRNNPPNRLECIYCGQELEFDDDQSQLLKPILRKLESHHNGYNLIYHANLEVWSKTQLNEVSKMTRLSTEKLNKIVENRKSLPIARVESLKEAEIASQRLEEIGISTVIKNDEIFEMDKVSKRLRRLDFSDDKLQLILFNNNEVVEIEKDNIALIVVGALFERKLETTELYKKKGESKVLDAAEISSDEIVIDIYSKSDLISYRILPKGFDFSFLGDEKQLLAMENIKILVKKLRVFAEDAGFDEAYLGARENLTDVWEVEELNDSKGMKRKSFGSYKRISVTSTSNMSQFTKYSRLQWILLEDK